MGVLVITLLLGHIFYAAINRIAKVEDDYRKMRELKGRAEAADVAKSQVLYFCYLCFLLCNIFVSVMARICGLIHNSYLELHMMIIIQHQNYFSFVIMLYNLLLDQN